MSEAIVATPSTSFILVERAWQVLSRLAVSLSDYLVGQQTLEQEANALIDLASQYEDRQPGFADDLRAAAERRLALGRGSA
jgi:hypothetical protein